MNDKITKELSIFGHCFWLCYKFISSVIFWALISWVIFLFAMCCIAFFKNNQFSISYAQSLLTGQLDYLMHFDYKVRLAVNVSHVIYQWLFIKTHILHYMQSLPQNHVLSELRNYFYILIEVTMLFAVKLVMVFLSIPLFILFGVVGLIDGLVQRDLRKFGGGRESSLLYHSAKRLIFPIFILGYVIYLLMPFNLLPEFIFLPFAVLFGFFIAMTMKSFKKYV